MSALALGEMQSRPGTHAVHRLGYYRTRYGLEPGQFPNAAAAEDTTITLPIVPFMRPAEQDRVVATVRKALTA
jgi:dTDP-4-amino-4,6-dideoxygalactose transaminase